VLNVEFVDRGMDGTVLGAFGELSSVVAKPAPNQNEGPDSLTIPLTSSC
jgi:hypothetical protein